MKHPWALEQSVRGQHI